MTSPPRFRRAARLAAATGAGILAATVALPAFAQTPDNPEVEFYLEELVVVGHEESYSASVHPDFGDDGYLAEHDVSTAFEIDAPEGTFVFDLPEYCAPAEIGIGVDCFSRPQDQIWSLWWDYRAADDAETGVYDYQMTVSVGGEAVEEFRGAIEVVGGEDPDPHRPFLHGAVEETDVAPGSTVDVTPKFRQEKALSDTAAAVVVTFGDPFGRVGIELDGAEAIADYDNCFDGQRYSDRGITCVITDYKDSPGSIFTLSGPIDYAVAPEATGPLAICHCYFSAFTVNASDLANEYGGEFWNPASSNLLGLETAEDWDGPVDEYDAPYMGHIIIVTGDNPFDLALEDVNVEGEAGDEVTVTVPVANNGPADAYSRVDSYGSYGVRAQLPAGLELMEVDPAGDWSCLGPESLEDAYEYQSDRTELDRFDFFCYARSLDAGASLDLTLTVEITDATEATDGLIEVREIYESQYTDSLDSDLGNNLAVIGVNAADQIGGGQDDDASGKLPVTGLSLTVVGGIAGAALAAGAVMFVLVRRRRAGADW